MNRRVETFTGRMVDPLDLKPQDVCIEDIAHALSMQCRYNGHSRVFYSVAEHSWKVSAFVGRHLRGNRDERLAALMHDAAEAYLHDMVTPIKRTTEMGALYSKSERAIMRVIADVFGFTFHSPARVCSADKIVGWIEADALMPSRGRTWPGYGPWARRWIEADNGDLRCTIASQGACASTGAEIRFLEIFAGLTCCPKEVPA